MTLYTGTSFDDSYSEMFATDDTYDLLAGNDHVMYENGGNETYIGGQGNDTFFDFEGDDTYVFNLGDGKDTIIDINGSNDCIRFGAGITRNSLSFSNVDNNLVISIKDTTDSITVTEWFVEREGYDYKIEYLLFENGTLLSKDEVDQIIEGRLIIGSDLDDAIIGNDLDNTLIGYLGNDVYTGGIGNDSIIDDAGNEIYNFNQGDGTDIISDYAGADIIKFGAGIAKSNLTFTQNENDLEITFNNSTDKITVTNWYYSADNKIERLEFADGTFIASTDIDASAPTIEPTIVGTDCCNRLWGTLGNDIFQGKKGNDSFTDRGGSDTYLFDKGDGTDYICDMSLKSKCKSKNKNKDVDTVIFGTDVSKEDVAFFMKGQTLYVNYGGCRDNVVIQNQKHELKGIEVFQLSNGLYLTDVQVNKVIQTMTAYAKKHHVCLHSISDVKRNDDLMNIIASSWHS